MQLYQKERAYLDQLKSDVANDKPMSKEELLEIIEKMEEMIDLNSVSVKIIDRLMHNYDKVKARVNSMDQKPQEHTI